MILREALDSLASRQVVLFGGKGGVGKTTLSAAAALHFSASRPTTLFTTDPASNLGDLFSAAPFRIESLDASALYARFLDENLSSFLELGDRGTYLDRDELRRFFELSLPGVDELMAWMRIGELAEAGDSLLVVDTAPTGHTLRMLGAADHFRQLAEALDAMQEKHRGIVRQLMRRNVRDAMDDFIASFAATAARRREVLAKAAFVPVMLSEPWVVEQTKRLVAEAGLDVPFVVLNRAVALDCARDRALSARDAEARAAFAAVVDAPRSCVPLDTPEAISSWLSGAAAASAAVYRRGGGTSTLAVARIVFLAGKGGVGKTTSSASIALQLAKKHKRVVVLSVDPAHSLRDVFAQEQPPENLEVHIVDTRAKWRRFRDKLGSEIERAISGLTPGNLSVAYDTEALQKLVEVAPPGADELFAINHLADLIADETIDAIVVDTAPTGHFLRLLDLPASAGEWVREFMRILLRYRELIPAGTLGEELIRANRALKDVDAALQSDQTRVIVVTRPERIVVAETKRLLAELDRRRIHLGGIIANYVTPENDCPCDRSMRAHEAAALDELGEVVIVERRDAPVTKLADLATLIPLPPMSSWA